MKKVLHVGPITSPGGMSKVMQLLSNNAPSGWESEVLCSTHPKNILKKLWLWQRAKWKVGRSSADIIHIHCASGWSFRRKLSIAKKAKSPVIFHIHSGQFDIQCRSLLETFHVVTLSEGWSKKLKPLIGESHVFLNPVDPLIKPSDIREDFALLLGRPDPVKGHDFAFELNLSNLVVTGVHSGPEHVDALGWVSEEKKRDLLSKARVLLVPSQFEGQPLVILEALAANCPVIASSTIIDLPDTVLMAEFGNRDSWEEALSNLKTCGLPESVNQHQIIHIRRQWGDFYDEIISNNFSTE